MPDYSELLSRIEQASGPDRELDVAIAVAVLDPKREKNYWMWQSGRPQGSAPKPDSEFWGSRNTPTFTASLDSTVALVERMEHAYGRKIICFHAGAQLMAGDMDYDPRAKPDNSVTVGWCAHVAFFDSRHANSTFGPDSYSHGKTPALALLSALFRALSAREAKDGE